jgi:tRNA(His) 5'-end guanylyltransferase
MNFDELEAKMRVFETAHDYCVLPQIYMVARLDGRSFTRLTKEVYHFASPFDEKFRDLMLATVEHLMNCGFKVLYGYTQSDEISLLFSLEEQTFGRKLRKYNSILAGEASARFSLLLGGIATFDCRICQLPNKELLLDYFSWRSEDTHRNALNSHCYWLLRNQGKPGELAARTLSGMSVAEKNELLFQAGLNFNDLPNWQKRGVGLVWENYQKAGTNPQTGAEVLVIRKRLKTLLDLPMKEDYRSFLNSLLTT